MSACRSTTSAIYDVSRKPRAAVLLDASNIALTARRKDIRVKFRRMCSGLSKEFDLVEKVAFLQPWLGKLGIFLLSIGFEIRIRQYNADAAIGIRAGRLIESGIEAIIICSMDGDFAGIEETASEMGVDVYYVGFKDSFSSLLRNKNLLPLEDLDCLEEKSFCLDSTDNEDSGLLS